MDTFATYNKTIAGYKDVSETVKVLEKIASGQLRALGHSTVLLASYTTQVLAMLFRVKQLSGSPVSISGNSDDRKVGRQLLVIVTGDRGLVGELWQTVFSAYTPNAREDILVIGKQGQKEWSESLSRVQHYSFAERVPTDTEVETLARLLNEYMEDGIYTSIVTLHPQSVSLSEQHPVRSPLLPITLHHLEETTGSTNGYPIIEGSLASLEQKLYKKYLWSRLKQIVLETAVAEYSARTVAMEHASTKTDETIIRVSRGYSRGRRQVETQKQLERFVANKIVV